MNIKEVMEFLLEVPIEEHETTQFKIKMYREDTGEELTQEEHHNLNVTLEMFLVPLESDAGSL